MTTGAKKANDLSVALMRMFFKPRTFSQILEVAILRRIGIVEQVLESL